MTPILLELVISFAALGFPWDTEGTGHSPEPSLFSLP